MAIYDNGKQSKGKAFDPDEFDRKMGLKGARSKN